MGNNTFLNYQIFKAASETYAKPVDELTPEESDDVVRIAERKMRIEEAVLASDEATKVVVGEQQIDEVVEEVKSRYEDSLDFDSDLAKVGLNVESLADALSRELYVNAVMEYVSSACEPISEDDVSLFYFMNLDKFKHPEIRIARHILVTVNEDNPENSRPQSLKKITQILERLRKKPERFEEQALKHSECPTSLEGGLLGSVKRGVLYPELEAVLFDLPEGQVSEVVESELGFHVIRCDEITEAGTLPLGEVSSRLKVHLDDRNRKQKQRQWLEGLLTSSTEKSTYEEIANG